MCSCEEVIRHDIAKSRDSEAQNEILHYWGSLLSGVYKPGRIFFYMALFSTSSLNECRFYRKYGFILLSVLENTTQILCQPP